MSATKELEVNRSSKAKAKGKELRPHLKNQELFLGSHTLTFDLSLDFCRSNVDDFKESRLLGLWPF